MNSKLSSEYISFCVTTPRSQTVRRRSSAEMLYLEVELATGWEDLLHFKKFEFKLVPLTLQVEDIFIQQVMLYLEGAGLKGTRPPP